MSDVIQGFNLVYSHSLDDDSVSKNKSQKPSTTDNIENLRSEYRKYLKSEFEEELQDETRQAESVQELTEGQ